MKSRFISGQARNLNTYSGFLRDDNRAGDVYSLNPRREKAKAWKTLLEKAFSRYTEFFHVP
jgi:hypothetical protein